MDDLFTGVVLIIVIFFAALGITFCIKANNEGRAYINLTSNVHVLKRSTHANSVEYVTYSAIRRRVVPN